MTTCKMCPKPVTGRRFKYCSEACRLEGHRLIGRERYHSDPAFAEHQKAKARAWKAAWQRSKAAKFARVLAAVTAAPERGRGEGAG